MRLSGTLLIVLILPIAVIFAGEDTKVCPADKAAADGQTAFEAFHEVVAPAWHTAWPNKDYDALIAAGPAFEKAFGSLAALNPPMANETRKLYFAKCRGELGGLVKQYAEAARAADKDKVYELLPALHEAFEKTAAATMKISYPAVNGLTVTIDLILNKHLPENNLEGITGSTETLLIRLSTMNEESLPDALIWDKENVMQKLAGLRITAELMKKCCQTNDMTTYKVRAGEFDSSLKTFVETYL
jgi:hypothetical protein